MATHSNIRASTFSPRSSVGSSGLQLLLPFTQSCLTLTLWTVTHQTPLFVGFSKQEYWRRLPLPSPEDFSTTQGSNLRLLHWQVDSLLLSHLGSPWSQYIFLDQM